MTLEERAEFAAKLKREGKCNCAQAVAVALADQTSSSEQELLAMTSGFCAGMGTMEATCGALIGTNIVLGSHQKGSGTLLLTRQMLLSFKKRCGALTCKDLKALTHGVPLCPCDECVRNAVLAYGEVTGLK